MAQIPDLNGQCFCYAAIANKFGIESAYTLVSAANIRLTVLW